MSTETILRTDAQRYAAEGMTAAVLHAMLIQPALDDIAGALEHQDWQRAIASAVECLRWTAAGEEILGGGTAGTGIEVDLMIAASTRGEQVDALRTITLYGRPAPERTARLAADAALAAEARFGERLPLRLPVRRTPTGYQPALELVSQLEQLRHRLGLPNFDWETWIG